MGVRTAVLTILAFLYLGLSSGIVKNLHYCMGELSNVAYGYDNEESCGSCGMKEKQGCCSTELKIVKLEDSHHWAKLLTLTKKTFSVTSLPDPQDELRLPTRVLYSNEPVYYSPPDNRSNQVYLRNMNLLI